jgi:hypothetical protein
LDFIAEKWGMDIANQVKISSYKYGSRGMVRLEDQQIILTREGKLFADGIASDLFMMDEMLSKP